MFAQFFIVLFIIFSLPHQVLAQNNEPSSIRFSGIPALGFGPDTGFGGGVVGSMYVDKTGFDPYKIAVGFKVFITTKGVNSHLIQLDRVRAFNKPLRLTGRLGFYSTIAENYCGKASDVLCDASKVTAIADSRGLTGGQRDDFMAHYYQNRFMLFFGDIFSRYVLFENEGKLELMSNYRGQYYLNRGFSQKGPYAGSLFATDFAQERIDGYLSTLELGLMYDKRNREPIATEGYWLESSVRFGSFLIASAWDYAGINLAARFYMPLDSDHRLVVASQSIADMVIGDLPLHAMSRIGGSQALFDHTAIGGQYIGRGIKEEGFVGRIKFIEQIEARYTFGSVNFSQHKFDFTAAGFSDLGMTAWDFTRFSKDMSKLYVGFGTGLRLYWNKTFVIRSDLAVSPSEEFSPKFYLTVGNVF